jgi:activating signal cointegrator complex subunit 3
VVIFISCWSVLSSIARRLHSSLLTPHLFTHIFTHMQELRELFDSGFGIHHAGMLRSDRNLAERSFAAGALRVLCCTATLAWGVNLPAHTVIIKGTEIYSAEAGGFIDLSVLDVMQVFGRAGRPQYDTSGEAVLITTHDGVPHYIRSLLHQAPIESKFIKALPDQLNAEIAAGQVVNVDEAVTWLSYTYLYIRMMRNPLVRMRGFIADDAPGVVVVIPRLIDRAMA